MADVFLSELAESELRELSPSDQKEVARAISFLEDDKFRKQNRINLLLIEDRHEIYALIVGIIWLGFYEDSDKLVMLVHMSIRSRFHAS